MPFLIPSQARIDHLINTYSEGGFEEAQITEKSCFFYYATELEEIGPIYIMDDFGNAQAVLNHWSIPRTGWYSIEH